MDLGTKTSYANDELNSYGKELDAQSCANAGHINIAWRAWTLFTQCN